MEVHGLLDPATHGSYLDSYGKFGPQLARVSESYTAWRFGLGLEIMVNPRLRIPFRLIGIYAPIERDTIDDLVVQDQDMPNGPTTGIRYRSTWQWQAQVSLGVIYDFKLF